MIFINFLPVPNIHFILFLFQNIILTKYILNGLFIEKTFLCYYKFSYLVFAFCMYGCGLYLGNVG
jgi:hypothetical protein